MRLTADPRPPLDQKGFTLVEVITAALIAVIAVVGLAYSFSAGRGMIDRYAAARDALAAAEQRMERLSILAIRDPSHAELAPGSYGPFPRALNGAPIGTERWTVAWVNDPADGTSDAPDYKLITVDIEWTWGSLLDRVRLTRIVLGT